MHIHYSLVYRTANNRRQSIDATPLGSKIHLWIDLHITSTPSRPKSFNVYDLWSHMV